VSSILSCSNAASDALQFVESLLEQFFQQAGRRKCQTLLAARDFPVELFQAQRAQALLIFDVAGASAHLEKVRVPRGGCNRVSLNVIFGTAKTSRSVNPLATIMGDQWVTSLD
jgi:hypothetical protein